MDAFCPGYVRNGVAGIVRTQRLEIINAVGRVNDKCAGQTQDCDFVWIADVRGFVFIGIHQSINALNRIGYIAKLRLLAVAVHRDRLTVSA
jgi:hypothetical protein